MGHVLSAAFQPKGVTTIPGYSHVEEGVLYEYTSYNPNFFTGPEQQYCYADEALAGKNFMYGLWLNNDNGKTLRRDKGGWPMAIPKPGEPFIKQMSGPFYVEPTGLWTKPMVAIINREVISTGEGLARGLKLAPKSTVVSMDDSTSASFGMADAEIKMPAIGEGFTLLFPFGRSVDADGNVQLDSDSTGVGGVHPDLKVERTLENMLNFVKRQISLTTGSPYNWNLPGKPRPSKAANPEDEDPELQLALAELKKKICGSSGALINC